MVVVNKSQYAQLLQHSEQLLHFPSALFHSACTDFNQHLKPSSATGVVLIKETQIQG